MGVGEWLACLAVLLLSLYGCAQLIRRLYLLATRCDSMVCFYQLAIPRTVGALEPLLRCLQAQTAWKEGPCRRTLVLLPELTQDELSMVERLVSEDPSVITVSKSDLALFIDELR